MSATKFILTTYLTIIFYTVVRFIGWRYFDQARLWFVTNNDKLHHWQLGILLIFMAITFLRKKKLAKDWLLAIGSGMVIDESMYAFFSWNQSFSHYSFLGVGLEFAIFLAFALIIYRLKSKSGKISS